MEINGTIIEVRNVFEISAAVSGIYKRQSEELNRFDLNFIPYIHSATLRLPDMRRLDEERGQ